MEAWEGFAYIINILRAKFWRFVASAFGFQEIGRIVKNLKLFSPFEPRGSKWDFSLRPHVLLDCDEPDDDFEP